MKIIKSLVKSDIIELIQTTTSFAVADSSEKGGLTSGNVYLSKTGKQVTATMSLANSPATASLATLSNFIPVGFRPSSNFYCSGKMGSPISFASVYILTSGAIQVFHLKTSDFTGTTGTTTGFFTVSWLSDE